MRYPKKTGILFFILIIACTTYAQDTKLKKELERRNILSVNVLNFVNYNGHVGYERIWGKGIIGTKLSVNYNFKDKNLENSSLNYQRDFTTGVDLNIYPTGQGVVSYFIGPSSRFGVVSNGDVSTTRKDKSTNKYWGVFLNNGVAVKPTETTYIGLQMALGIEFFEPLNASPQTPKLSTEQFGGFIGFNLGFQL